MADSVYISVGVGRFRILGGGGASFRILGGGGGGGGARGGVTSHQRHFDAMCPIGF